MWLLQGVPREIEEVLRLEVEWLLVRIREEMKKVGSFGVEERREDQVVARGQAGNIGIFFVDTIHLKHLGHFAAL